MNFSTNLKNMNRSRLAFNITHRPPGCELEWCYVMSQRAYGLELLLKLETALSLVCVSSKEAGKPEQ